MNSRFRIAIWVVAATVSWTSGCQRSVKETQSPSGSKAAQQVASGNTPTAGQVVVSQPADGTGSDNTNSIESNTKAVESSNGQGSIIELNPDPPVEVQALPKDPKPIEPVAQDAPVLAPESLASIAETNATEGTITSAVDDVPISPVTVDVVATQEERNQKIAQDWPEPQAVLYLSGQQQGYIEPCGCTGLESQKGGLIRRDTLLTDLRQRGWQVVPIDVGNQVRRAGAQSLIKFETSARALQQMGYEAVTLGINDLKLSKVDLIQIAGSEANSPRPFISANVAVLLSDFWPNSKVVQAGGRKIGITAVMGQQHKADIKDELEGGEVEFADPVVSLQKVVPDLQAQGCDYIVLLAHASLAESAELARSVPGIHLVVTSGGFGEPTLNPEPIEGSQTLMLQVGTKGMYGGIVGLFDDPQQPVRYQRLAISSQFKDSQRMLELFASYQDRLKEAGLSGLGLSPATHPSGRKFVGSEVCGDCHTKAFEIWKDSPHVHATDSIVAANNDRGGIARHFDPECLSCHVTGWNPQGFSPYESGYTSLDQSEHLLGSGCENCHGPGSAHSAAELGDIEASADMLKQLREEMILPLAKAEVKCMECHDLDNSPAFHEPGAFDKFWEQVKHYGKD